MIDYSRVSYPVRDDLVECHRQVHANLGAPGSWWTGSERLAIAAEARAARECALCAERKAALSPFAIDGTHGGSAALPAEVVDVVHRIVTDPGRLAKSWCDSVLDKTLDDGRYVELIGTLVTITALDIFARAVGAGAAALPDSQAGDPRGDRPASARFEGAWVPQVPFGEAGGDDARRIYGGLGAVPNIGRALSLVPSQVANLRAISGPHYMTIDHVADPTYETPGRALDRLQMELVAARVSKLNDCFYWTTAHAGLLRVSGMVRETEIDLAAVRGDARATGVAHDGVLLAFTDAVMANDAPAIAATRDAVEAVLGAEGVVDTAAVIAMFNVVDRVADATGIPVDDNVAREMRYEVGEELGMLDLAPEQRAAR